MKHLLNKKTLQKIVLVIITLFSLNIISYPMSYAEDLVRPEEKSDGGGGVLATPVAALLNTIGDAMNALLQSMLIGANTQWPVINGSEATTYMEVTKAALPDDTSLPEIRITRSKLEPWVGNYDIATIKLTPAEIFSGNVAALDANFFASAESYDKKLGGEDNSIVEDLKNIVAGWYVAIRNISIVGLLSVLVYLGIRMIISSSVGDKAKYKQMFLDWIIALCLIFFLHYIMSFAMTLSEAITDMLAGSNSGDGSINQVIIQLTDDSDNNLDGRRFYSNFVNVARIKTQLPSAASKLGYVTLYLALTFFTIYFVFIYIKRLIMLAFLTMIAPFVALTYPLDKLKDGHAQAFDFWIKDYIFYAMLQPLHMLLYSVFVSSALSIASSNMLYAIVAMAFIMPAEKIVKQMFGIKGNTESNISGFAGGAVASTVLNKLNRPSKSPNSSSGSSGGGQSKPRIARNPSGASAMDALMSGPNPAKGGSSTLTRGAAGAAAGAASGAASGAAAGAEGAAAGAIAGAASGAASGAAGSASGAAGLLGGAKGGTSGLGNAVLSGSKSGTGTGRASKKLENANNRKLLNRVGNSSFGRAVSRRYKLAGGGIGVMKSLGKGSLGVARVLSKPAGIAAGAILGGALGMVGDGPEGMLKGMGVGAAAGPGILNRGINAIDNTANGISNVIGNTISGKNAVGGFISEVKNGGVNESLRKRGEYDYVHNKENLERILQDNPDMSAKEIREHARKEYNMMYDSKTDDVDLANKALALENSFMNDDKMSSDDAHKRASGILNASKSFDKSIFNSDKKLWEAEDAVVNNLQSKGMSKDEAVARTDRTFQDLADLYGMGNQVNIQNLRAQRAKKDQTQQRKQNNNNPKPVSRAKKAGQGGKKAKKNGRK